MISSIELLVILVVAIIVIPSNEWPKVLRAVMNLVRKVKRIIGQIEDKVEDIENEIMKDLPVEELRKKTTEDLLLGFATPIKARKGQLVANSYKPIKPRIRKIVKK